MATWGKTMMTVGKYKGLGYGYICEEHPSYCQWLADRVSTLKEPILLDFLAYRECCASTQVEVEVMSNCIPGSTKLRRYV